MSNTDKETAAEHCRNYAEVTGVIWQNGKGNYDNVKDYKDWRLPTAAEIAVIEEYQRTTNSAVDKVLAGSYYWSASGAVKIEGGSGGSKTNAYIRCIRDVK